MRGTIDDSENESSYDYAGMSHTLIEASKAYGDILDIENYRGHSRTKRLLLDEIESVAKNIINTPEPQHDEPSATVNSLVNSPRVSTPLFRYMLERNELPTEIEGCRCVYELDRYRIKVRVVPSGCHDATAEMIGDEMALWKASGGDRSSLISVGGGCTTLTFQCANDSMGLCPR
jgi:hypothetical protein